MSGPKKKRATLLGTVTTPTILIARINCLRTSMTFFSIANLDRCGKSAVTIEIVTIE